VLTIQRLKNSKEFQLLKNPEFNFLKVTCGMVLEISYLESLNRRTEASRGVPTPFRVRLTSVRGGRRDLSRSTSAQPKRQGQRGVSPVGDDDECGVEDDEY